MNRSKRAEAEVPPAERERALTSARAHWLLALGELEVPGRRPCLVLVGGLPGTGKSTLAAGLADRAGCTVIRSDVVRKELASIPANARRTAPNGQGLYTPAWTDRTYAECLRLAEEALFEGRRVIVDASFREDARRQAFLALADRWAVPAVFLHCQAPPELVRERLARRTGDASDADWAVYRQAAARWEAPADRTRQAMWPIDTGAGPEPALEAALTVLRTAAMLN